MKYVHVQSLAFDTFILIPVSVLSNASVTFNFKFLSNSQL